MSESVKLLKEILLTSHWTQERLAANLGVSQATVNSWLNGRTKPQRSMIEQIRRVYLAQDVTKAPQPIYITLVNIDKDLSVGEYVILQKDTDNPRDDEAIIAYTTNEYMDEDGDGENEDVVYDGDEGLGEIKVYSGDYVSLDYMYVANSVSSVARGTYSAGRIYDKFDSEARAKVVFIHHNAAIAQVVDWNYRN
jgi:transcriptional regulator with XRE-family HTH domain